MGVIASSRSPTAHSRGLLLLPSLQAVPRRVTMPGRAHPAWGASSRSRGFSIQIPAPGQAGGHGGRAPNTYQQVAPQHRARQRAGPSPPLVPSYPAPSLLSHPIPPHPFPVPAPSLSSRPVPSHRQQRGNVAVSLPSRGRGTGTRSVPDFLCWLQTGNRERGSQQIGT